MDHGLLLVVSKWRSADGGGSQERKHAFVQFAPSRTSIVRGGELLVNEQSRRSR